MSKTSRGQQVTNKLNIVNINGNSYDAKTGKLLPNNLTHHKPSPRPRAGLAMDGVVRPAKHRAANSAAARLFSPPILKPHKLVKPAESIHQRTLRSKTLSRKAVSKPESHPGIHSHSKIHTIADKTVPSQGKTSIFKPSPARAARLQDIKRSQMIQKFTPASKKKLAQPVPAAVQGELVSQTAVVSDSSEPNNFPPILPSTIASATHGKIDQLVDSALSSATAHKQKPLKKIHVYRRMPKLISAGIVLLAVVILGCFFAYQYMPNVAMRVASTRAGVDASMPGYQPSGFVFKSIDTSPGAVVVNYSSNGDSQRKFRVLQKSSNWDSQSLLSNYVSQQSKNYQTFNENGKTIYMYSSDSATWVNRGIWYIVDGGTADLNSDQLLKIADSI